MTPEKYLLQSLTAYSRELRNGIEYAEKSLREAKRKQLPSVYSWQKQVIMLKRVRKNIQRIINNAENLQDKQLIQQ